MPAHVRGTGTWSRRWINYSWYLGGWSWNRRDRPGDSWTKCVSVAVKWSHKAPWSRRSTVAMAMPCQLLRSVTRRRRIGLGFGCGFGFGLDHACGHDSEDGWAESDSDSNSNLDLWAAQRQLNERPASIMSRPQKRREHRTELGKNKKEN